MNQIIRYSCLFIVLLMGSEVSALQIQLKESVEVQRETVSLGQIATITPDSIYSPLLMDMVVLRSLKAGSESVLKSASIKALVDKNNNDDFEVEWGGAQEIRVSRAAIVVDQRAIEEILNGFIISHQQQLPVADIHFKKIQAVKPVYLPVGMLDVEVIPSDPAILKSRSFSLIFKVDGRVQKNMTVRCVLEVIAPVAVAARDLRRGEMIDEMDVISSKVDVVKIRRPYMTVNELVGKKIKRSIKQGKLFYQGMVETPPMIRRGDLVTIAASKGGLLVTAKGIAQHNGLEDEMIRVRNSSSRKDIICKVREPGLVTVVF